MNGAAARFRRAAAAAYTIVLAMEGTAVKYMLLIYLDEKAANDADREQCYKDSAHFARALHAGGKYLSANPLEPTATATCVRMRDDKPFVTDGPFMETREQLGGYFLIDA